MARHRILLALLALVICTGTALATPKLTLTAHVVTALACNTNTGGSGSETITVTAPALTPGTGSSEVYVTVTTIPAGITIVGPGNASPSTAQGFTTSAGVVYTVTPSNACGSAVPAETSGSSTYAPTTLQFSYWQGATANLGTATYTADATQSLSVAETTPTSVSPLTATPSSLNIACVLSAGVYSAASTTFTLNTTALATAAQTASFASTPAWLTLSSALGPYSVPGSGNVQITASATGGANGQCASVGGLGASKTTTLSVTTAAPALATVTLSIPVTITVVGPQQLTVSGNGSASGTPLTLPTYTRYGSQVQGTLTLASVNAVSFQVDMTTMPNWLTVSATSGHVAAHGTTTLSFYSTTVADSMTPGNYETGVGSYQAISLTVAGYQNTPVYVKLVVQNTTPTLSVLGGLVQNLSWNSLQTLPTTTITLVSSSSTPIPFTITTADGSAPAGATVSPSAGLAFSSGTAIGVTFSALDFAGAVTGSTLSSIVTISWPGEPTNTPIVVTLNVAIQAPNSTAVLTGIAPSNLPSGASGETFTVMLYGSGFVPSPLSSQATFVGLVPSGGALQSDPNVVATVLSSTEISVIVTVPSSDANLSFSAPGTVTLGVCNPNNSTATPPCIASSTIKLAIDQGPTILTNGVTSASTFQPANLAPYDIFSIFGTNFCTSGGTGCGNGQVLSPTIIAPTATVSASLYPTSVTPDVPGAPRLLQVFFCKGANLPSTTIIGNGSSTIPCYAAPMLFATNNQINAIVPGEVNTAASANWSLFVRFATAATINTTTFAAGSSSAYAITAAATDPGVFIVDSGNDGAIVLPNGQVADGVLVGSVVNAARVRPAVSATNYSDTVEIYMTGLGAPPTAGGSPAMPAACTTVAQFAANAGLTSTNQYLDGAVLNTSDFQAGAITPCFVGGGSGTDPITLKIGGQTVTPSYVGWAPDEVAGLYQVNVQLPALDNTHQNAELAANSTYLTSASSPFQVPVVVSVSGTPTGQSIYIWVQPAMTLTDSTSGGTLTVSTTMATLTSTPAFDALTATGGNGTTTAWAVVTDSLSSSPTSGSGAFAVDSSGNVSVADLSKIGPGVYTVTISATDTAPILNGSALLPVEYITLTISIPS